LYPEEDAPYVGGESNKGELKMADTVKKPRAAAKPRKTAFKKENISGKPTMPPREQVEELARRYWAQRGYQDGYAEQDWLRAEQELLQMAS
jgi:Protein of unknown function (DUF2934)